MNVLKKRYLVPGLALLLAGCSSTPRQEAPVVDITDSRRGQSTPVTQSAINTDPLVVAGLQKNASELSRKGESARAASILERALRIQPRNAQLWYDLAQVRYSQKRYQQAESLALRSNQYASRQQALKRANWLLIAKAREKQGNAKGAVFARKQAQRFTGN